MLKQVLILLLLTFSTFAKVERHEGKPSETHATNPSIKDTDELAVKKNFLHEFSLRRREHRTASISMKDIPKDQQRPFLEDVLKNIKQILLEAREFIERVNYKPTDPFPHDGDSLRSNLAKVLENTAFFCDLSLQFKTPVSKLLKKDRKLRTVLVWAYDFVIQTDYFKDDTLLNLILMAENNELVAIDERAKKIKAKLQKKEKSTKVDEKKPRKNVKGEL